MISVRVFICAGLEFRGTGWCIMHAVLTISNKIRLGIMDEEKERKRERERKLGLINLDMQLALLCLCSYIIS